MIEAEKRKVIYWLHKEGISIREISRRLKVCRKSIRAIIAQAGNMPDPERKDRIEIDPQQLGQLYAKCDGRVQRIHEILTEQQGIKVGYSTLTRLLRDLNISRPTKQRCGRVPDEPGAEMQHDTSAYRVKIGGKPMPVIASLLYFRYSKMRYLKFYRHFNRFKMKCFFHEALTFLEFSARVCIIDNTNLARLRGTGKDAVIVDEMRQFAQQYGFEFICHEKGHPNRKAGNERGFFTTETNFFPGRVFESLEDLNRQAFEWATDKMAKRPVSKTDLIPAKAFEQEKFYLNPLPPYIEPPYIAHGRKIDQYGYISFGGNFYWIPGTGRMEVKVLEYSDQIKIYHKRTCLVHYSLPADGVKNQSFYPEGKSKPLYQPKYRKKTSGVEEKKLRALSKEVETYLDFALKQIPAGRPKHYFIRQLYGLHKKVVVPLFIKTLQRAQKYRITDINTLEQILQLLLREGNYQMPYPVQSCDEEFVQRESYLEGRFSDEADLSIYEKILESGV